MKEDKAVTVKSVHLPDTTTLVEIEGEDFLFHVPSIHVTYRSCYLPLQVYLSKKDHGLGGCTGWKPDSPYIQQSSTRSQTSDYRSDFVKFGSEVGIHLNGSSRSVCTKRYPAEDIHACMDRQDEAGERLKSALTSLLASFAQASSDNELKQALLQTARLSLCVAKAAVDGGQSDALDGERCWLTDRLKPIPGVIEHPTMLGR